VGHGAQVCRIPFFLGASGLFCQAGLLASRPHGSITSVWPFLKVKDPLLLQQVWVRIRQVTGTDVLFSNPSDAGVWKGAFVGRRL